MEVYLQSNDPGELTVSITSPQAGEEYLDHETIHFTSEIGNPLISGENCKWYWSYPVENTIFSEECECEGSANDFGIAPGNRTITLHVSDAVRETKDQVLIKVHSTVGLEENDKPNNKIWPNPASDRLFIKTQEKIDCIEICNISGQVISKSENPDKRPEYELDISKLAKGMYILKLYSAKGLTIEKFVK